ncbi:MAG: DUF1640 domain-containing protein, partial [Crenarchaeota archaeon]|nr:DUF1640 domain-containing protein [Thermoproteota archaeon]
RTDLERKIEDVRSDLERKIEAVRDELKEDIRSVENKVEALKGELDVKVESVRKEIAEMRAQFNSLMKWMIGLMASMWISIVVGIIVALMKLG